MRVALSCPDSALAAIHSQDPWKSEFVHGVHKRCSLFCGLRYIGYWFKGKVHICCALAFNPIVTNGCPLDRADRFQTSRSHLSIKSSSAFSNPECSTSLMVLWCGKACSKDKNSRSSLGCASSLSSASLSSAKTKRMQRSVRPDAQSRWTQNHFRGVQDMRSVCSAHTACKCYLRSDFPDDSVFEAFSSSSSNLSALRRLLMRLLKTMYEHVIWLDSSTTKNDFSNRRYASCACSSRDTLGYVKGWVAVLQDLSNGLSHKLMSTLWGRPRPLEKCEWAC